MPSCVFFTSISARPANSHYFAVFNKLTYAQLSVTAVYAITYTYKIFTVKDGYSVELPFLLIVSCVVILDSF